MVKFTESYRLILGQSHLFKLDWNPSILACLNVQFGTSITVELLFLSINVNVLRIDSAELHPFPY